MTEVNGVSLCAFKMIPCASLLPQGLEAAYESRTPPLAPWPGSEDRKPPEAYTQPVPRGPGSKIALDDVESP